MDWSIPIIILQLIFLEGLLSIDNAAVLGAMVVHLPSDKAIIWPRGMRKFGDSLHPILGNQRMAALRVGLLGAYIGRGLMLLAASVIVQNPWLKVLGAVYLIRLAFDNLGMAEQGEDDAHVNPVESKTFWSVVLTVEIADLVFSLDNVVAAVSLSDKIWVIMLGVAIGILMMRFAAGWFSYFIEREPVLKTAAYILILNIGIELLVSEFSTIEIGDFVRFGISIATILLCLAYAHSKFLQKFKPVLVWIAQGFANFNEVIDWAMVPFIALFKLVFRLLTWLLRPVYDQLFPHHEHQEQHSEEQELKRGYIIEYPADPLDTRFPQPQHK
jgi:tellurite resistance protein TerC